MTPAINQTQLPQRHNEDRLTGLTARPPTHNQSLYFTESTNRITGSSYDDAGNLLNDGAHAYTYDGENRIRTVDGATAYVYDGEGQRVRKLLGENTRFVYGIGGQLIMEFSGSNGSIKKEYVYGGGSMATIAPNGKGSLGVQYLTSDHLGTPRVITKADGSVAARHDYKPFGEELFAGKGGRTTGMGYGGSDGNRQKFTGYPRDNETGLDFAQARYNSSTQGRFTSPDSLMGSIGNPQSLNRYAYVNNNPMNFTDPTGHMPSGGGAPTIHDGEGGGGSRWDDPNSDMGFPQRYLDEINGWIAENEAHEAPSAGEGVAEGRPLPLAEGNSAVSSDSGTLTGTVVDPADPSPQGGAAPVSATGGRRNTVIITNSDGSQEVRSGGTRTWRNNNPGNIRPDGNLWGEIGSAGRFIVFSSEAAGGAAITTLLLRPRYQAQTVFGAIATWAPPTDHNDTPAYQRRVEALTGIPGQTRMNTLSADQLRSVVSAIRTVEGWSVGRVTYVRPRR